MKINTLLIGSGGREHALALAISESQSCGTFFTAPGNPGINKLAEKADIDLNNHTSVIQFCQKNDIRLVVIGPEQPLADGLSDSLSGMGIPVFGPSKYAAQLESSKDFSKIIMQSNNIPTAAYRTFTVSEQKEAHKYIDTHLLPIVLKADGLAAGKGVVIAETHQAAHDAIDNMFGGEFGNAGHRVVIEEFLRGEEASVFVVCDGSDYLILPASQDHKRIGDNDTGKNTGGMGAYSPTRIVTPEVLQKVENRIIQPVLKAMMEKGYPYRGCLYVGLMIHNSEPKVVEFNARFGDPETQVVLPLIKGDLVKLFFTAAIGKIEKNSVEILSDKYSVIIVLASDGYPDSFQKGFTITLPAELDENQFVYHAGTAQKDGKLLTNGGRVLGAVAIENTLENAINSAYQLAEKISFENKYYRTDIGKKGLQTN